MKAAGIWFAVLWTVAPPMCKAQPVLLACMAAAYAGDDVGVQAEADPLQHILQRVHNSEGDVNIIASAMSEAKTAGFCAESLSQIRQVSQVAIMSAFKEETRFKEALKVLHYRMQTAKFAKTMEVALQKADESGIPPHLPAMKKYVKRWQTRQKQEGASPTSDRSPAVDDIEQVARVSGDTEADDEAIVAPRRLLLRQHGASLGDSSSWSSPPMVLTVTIALTVLFIGVVWFIRSRSARDSSASRELSKPPASAKRKGKARSRQSQRQQQTKKQPKTDKGGKEAKTLHQGTATEAVPVSLVAMPNSIDSFNSVESTRNIVDSVNSEGSGKVAARTNSKSRKKRGERGSRKTASKHTQTDLNDLSSDPAAIASVRGDQCLLEEQWTPVITPRDRVQKKRAAKQERLQMEAKETGAQNQQSGAGRANQDVAAAVCKPVALGPVQAPRLEFEELEHEDLSQARTEGRERKRSMLSPSAVAARTGGWNNTAVSPGAVFAQLPRTESNSVLAPEGVQRPQAVIPMNAQPAGLEGSYGAEALPTDQQLKLQLYQQQQQQQIYFEQLAEQRRQATAGGHAVIVDDEGGDIDLVTVETVVFIGKYYLVDSGTLEVYDFQDGVNEVVNPESIGYWHPESFSVHFFVPPNWGQAVPVEENMPADGAQKSVSAPISPPSSEASASPPASNADTDSEGEADHGGATAEGPPAGSEAQQRYA